MNKIIVTLLLTVGTACNTELEDPNIVPKNDMLILEASEYSIMYAAQDTISITAKMPIEAGRLDVKFTATHGRFIASAANTVNQYADSIAGDYRFSIVLFTSDSTATKIYLAAEVLTTRERIKIDVIK